MMGAPTVGMKLALRTGPQACRQVAPRAASGAVVEDAAVARSHRAFLILMGCAALAGCGTSDPSLTDRGDIQRQARITIPESATRIHCATDAVHRGPNAATYGRFDIPQTDLHLLLAGMPGEPQTTPYSGYSVVTSHRMKQPWWQPESLARKQVAEWSMSGYSVNLLIGENGVKDSLTVYFFNFSR